MNDKIYQQYIYEIQQYQQINTDEEKKLAEHIKARHTYNKEVPIDVEEKAVQAINRLVTSNLKLVVKIANSLTKNEKDRMDLISEGNRGLMRAAETFDPDKGAKFSVYSSFWIKQFINKYVYKNSNLFKLPDKVWSNKYKVAYFIEEYEILYGNKPSVTKIGEALQISENAVLNVLDMDRKMVNLNNSPLDGDDDSCNDEIVTLDDGKTPENYCMSKESLLLVREVIDSLPAREKNIIIKRYGLDGNTPETLQVIGREYNLTQERIRQLENLVIDQLKTILVNKLVDINPLNSTLIYT